MGRRLICDLESNGLYFDVTRIHLYLMLDMDTEEVFAFREHQAEEALKMLSEADLTVWHNGIDYDVPVLEKLHPEFSTNAKIRDTLVLSRLIYSDIKESDFDLFRKGTLPGKLIGSHGLKAWGYRLNVLKGEFGGEVDSWDEWSPEMEEYGIQDLHVTNALWKYLNKQIDKQKYSQEAILLEHRFADLIAKITRNGFPFNEEKALDLYKTLDARRTALTDRLLAQFTPWYKAKKWVKPWQEAAVETPKRTIRYKVPTDADRTAGAPFCPIILEKFNPGSRDQIAARLQRMYGWVPKEFTETGKAKVSEDVLRDLVGDDDEEVEDDEDVLYERLVTSVPQAKDLADYFLVQKRIGQLAEGKNGWLKLVRDGKVHGSVNSLGAVTRRVTHARPNMSQCPAVRSPYGWEMRELWEVPKGWMLFGTDLSGIEIRCFADALAEFDGGEYGKIVVEGDVHTVNQKAFGVPTRDHSKTTLYALLLNKSLREVTHVE